jgi:hypothetical protein
MPKNIRKMRKSMNNVTIAFLSMGDRPHAKYCAMSLKKNMPDAKIVQITDIVTPQLECVDEVVRHDFKDEMMVNIVRGFKELEWDGTLITTADDCILDKPLDKELEGEFDVAIPFLKNVIRIKKKSTKETKVYSQRKFPYMNGLVIVRNKEFYNDCYEELMKIKDDDFEGQSYGKWWGDMACIREVIESGKYTAKLLPSTLYSKKPQYSGHTDNKVIMWHYAGKRKDWMEYHENWSVCV